MILEALFSMGTFIINAARQIIPQVAAFVVRAVVKEVNATFGTTIAIPSSNKIISVKNVNAEIEDLERKKWRDGRLSPGDEDRYQELEAKREQEAQEYRRAKQQEIVAEANKNPDGFVESKLTDGKTNLLQYHLGQSTLGKPCPKCGSPMLLKQTATGDSFRDFFWGCRNYFRRDGDPMKCNTTLSFRPSDVSLLYKDVSELQCSTDDLNLIMSERVVQSSVQNRIDNHIRSEHEDVLCPVHQIPMVLLPRNDNDGTLLSMYRLDCPSFNCNQKIRLKSNAQIIALLRKKEGKGILD